MKQHCFARIQPRLQQETDDRIGKGIKFSDRSNSDGVALFHFPCGFDQAAGFGDESAARQPLHEMT